MNYIRKTFPPFFLKIDHFLLVNYPHIWATHLHYVVAWVVFYGVIFEGMMMLYPISSDNIPNFQNLLYLSFVPNVIAFSFWIYKLHQFKITDNFGFISKSKQIVTHLVYIFCVFLLAYSPRFYLKSLFYRVENVVSKEKLITDYHYISNFSKLMRMYRLSDDSLHYIHPDKVPYLHSTALLCYKHNGLKFIEAQDKIQNIDNEELIKRGLTAFNEYSPQKMDISAIEISRKIKNKEYKSLALPFNALHHELSSNLYVIAQTQYDKSLWNNALKYPAYANFGLLGISLLVIWFLSVKPKTFLFAMMMLLVGGFMHLFFLNYLFQIRNGEYFISFYKDLFWYYISILIILALFMYWKRKSRQTLLFQMLLLIINMGITGVPALFIHNIAPHDYPAYFQFFMQNQTYYLALIYVSLFLAYFVWLFFIGNKVRNLQAKPQN